MLAKTLLFTILGSCAVQPSQAGGPDERPYEPPVEPEEGQHFCCESLGGDGSGNGCITIDTSHVGKCDKLLYCGGTYEKDGGKVTCIS